MTITSMLLWIAVTTVYGILMYGRGKVVGAREMVDLQEEAGIFPDKKKMYVRLLEYVNTVDEEDEDE